MSRARPGGRGALGTAFAAAIFLLSLHSGCNRDQPPGPAPSGEEPQQVIRDFSTTESDSGQVRYVFKAVVARIYAHDVTRAEDIQVDFYDRGQKVSVLTAKRGYLDDSGRMTAEGNAKVITTEGAVLEADKIYWDVDKQKIRSDDPVKITKRGEVLRGIGISADQHLDLIQFEREVVGDAIVSPKSKDDAPLGAKQTVGVPKKKSR